MFACGQQRRTDSCNESWVGGRVQRWNLHLFKTFSYLLLVSPNRRTEGQTVALIMTDWWLTLLSSSCSHTSRSGWDQWGLSHSVLSQLCSPAWSQFNKDISEIRRYGSKENQSGKGHGNTTFWYYHSHTPAWGVALVELDQVHNILLFHDNHLEGFLLKLSGFVSVPNQQECEDISNKTRLHRSVWGIKGEKFMTLYALGKVFSNLNQTRPREFTWTRYGLDLDLDRSLTIWCFLCWCPQLLFCPFIHILSVLRQNCSSRSPADDIAFASSSS